jgi:transcription elongation factor SPT4
MASKDLDLRACMVCSAVQTYDDFVAHGCPNCCNGGATGYDLELRDSPDRVEEATSAVFANVVGVADVEGSWVARFLRLNGGAAGIYAMRVTGQLPTDVADALSSRNIVPAIDR